jgi:hypothetical protein
VRAEYVAVVEVDPSRRSDSAAVGAVRGGPHPLAGTAPSGYQEFRITFEAESLTHAGVKAIASIRSATGAEVVACQVMTRAEYDDRMGLETGILGGRTTGDRTLRPTGQQLRQDSERRRRLRLPVRR